MKQICETKEGTYLVELTEAELLVIQESIVQEMIMALETELDDKTNA